MKLSLDFHFYAAKFLIFVNIDFPFELKKMRTQKEKSKHYKKKIKKNTQMMNKLLGKNPVTSKLAKKSLLGSQCGVRRFSNGAENQQQQSQVSTQRRHKNRGVAKSLWDDPWKMMNRDFFEDDHFMKNFLRDPFDMKHWPVPDFSISKFQDSDFLPSVDVKEDEKSLYIHADLPGMNKDQVKVRIEENNILCIEGERSEQKEEKESKRHRIERKFGKFSRRFSLPENADVNSLKAKFAEGVLEINIQKKPQEAQNVREITIE